MQCDFDGRLDHVRRVAEEKFDDCILIHMPHYVLHGSAHSKSIEKHLGEFLSAHVDTLKLNDYEKFLLISAIWLHDIGMTYAKYEGEDPETIRKEHHERSRDMILDRDFQNVLGLKSLEGDIVATISFLHRRYEDIIETLKRYEKLTYDGISYYGKSVTYKKTNFVINIEKLSMLLRILDACDRDHERTKDIEIIAKVAKLPAESVMHHYVQGLIDRVEFKKDEILLHSHIFDETDKNIINQIVCNDIKRELDSLEHLLKKYDLYGLSVKQVPSQISGTSLPKEQYECYEDWRIRHLTFPEVKFRYFLVEKNVYISKNGHAIIESKYDTVVNDLIDSFPHSFGADESTPPDFRFNSLLTMENEPLENRFTKQTFFYRILEHSSKDPISISARERGDIYDPFVYKEFDLKIDKKLEENTRIKYGWGYSAPNFFDVKNTREMTSSYVAYCDMGKMLFSIWFERGLKTTGFRLLAFGEGDKEMLCIKLDKPKNEYSSEGIFKYKIANYLTYIKHTIEIVNPKKDRSFTIKWGFQKGE
jgi:predicted HD phosphohydrolase